MKTRVPLMAAFLLVLALLAASVVLGQEEATRPESQPEALLASGFTYQGELEGSGGLVNGNCDFSFALWSAASGGSQIGSFDQHNNVAVTDGRFTVIVNDGNEFTSSGFNGSDRWLQVLVRCPATTGTWTGLSPRQKITAAPLATYASVAPWNGVFSKPAGFADNVDNVNDTVSYSEISGIVGGGSQNVAQGNHNHFNQTWSGSATYGLRLNNSSTYGLYARGATYAGYFEDGDVVVEDTGGLGVFEFDSSVAFLTLGVAGNPGGDDGDLLVYDIQGDLMLNLDGGTGTLNIYDGSASAFSKFEIDPIEETGNPSPNEDGTTIWGDRSSSIRDLYLKSNDDVHVRLEHGSGAAGQFFIEDDTGTAGCTFTASSGSYFCSGTKSAAVPFADGVTRAMYTVESPVVVFEDFGQAKLADGAVVVTIDPLFAETVNLGVDYQVFLTPVDGWAALYVANKTATSFEVRDAQGSANLSFDYRIVARRKGYENVRMEPVINEADIEVSQELDAVEVTNVELDAGPEAQSQAPPGVTLVAPDPNSP